MSASANKRYNKYEFVDDYVIGYTRTNDYMFMIDVEDYELVHQYCWHRHRDGYLRTLYSYYYDENGKRHNKYILMHNLILCRLDASCGDVDHIDGNPANNRKNNLRIISHVQNGMNHKVYTKNKTGCSGVYYNKLNGKYYSQIYVNKTRKHLGVFSRLEDAIAARKEAEKIYYGEYARSE